jgi:Dyp-type peroxidase family
MDPARIQGFVVRGYRMPFAGLLFVRVDDPPRARAWLEGLIPHVLTAAPWSEKPDGGVNVAFTFAGLVALELSDASLAGFPEEFRAGMAGRAALLGDDPSEWEPGFGTGEIHVLVMISAQTREALDAHDRRVRAALDGVSLVTDQDGAALPTGREHFGFADGLSQPALDDAAGEFILGHRDAEGFLPSAPAPRALSDNGSYLVYRKLSQDVEGFRRLLAEAGYPGGDELLAAKLVGRRRDGTPLARSDTFDFSDDPDGFACPIGSHIRRSNPRAGMPFGAKLVQRHRILRRGISYDDGGDRGLLFMCLQASIARQFEFVQSQWLADGNAFRLGGDEDPLLGRGGKMTIQGRPPFFLGPLPRLVTVRGGEYLFVPGVEGLRHLARLP